MMQFLKCKLCGSEQDSRAIFCGSCGESLRGIQNTGSVQRKTLRRLGILSCAKVMTVVIGLIAMPIAVLFGLGMLVTGSPVEGIMVMVLAPISYMLFYFICVLIGTWLFNIALGWTGGIEVDLS